MMASQARGELQHANSHLAEIADTLHRQERKEAREQVAKNMLFELKKTLLGIGKRPFDGQAVYTLAQIINLCSHSSGLNEHQFSALSDKEYFLATVELAHELRQRTAAKLGARRVG